FGDARIDFSYTFAAYDVDGTFTRLRWGGLGVSTYVVFDRRWFLNPSCSVFDGGGQCSVGAGYYVTQNLGIMAGPSVQNGGYYANDDATFDRYSGNVGVSLWVAPRVRLASYYTFTLDHVPNQTIGTVTLRPYDEPQHMLTLEALLRL